VFAHIARDGILGISDGDPYFCDARNVFDEFKSRLPGLTEDLPMRRNIWGEPIVRNGGLGPDILSPIYASQDKHDAISDELVRLGVTVPQVPRKIRGVDLDANQFDAYQILAGQSAKKLAGTLIRSPRYQGRSDGVKAELINRVLTATRQRATKQILAAYPDLLRQSVGKKAKGLTAPRRAIAR
jgi:hypothetical protein